jgi:hypothetical protein
MLSLRPWRAVAIALSLTVGIGTVSAPLKVNP